MQVQRSLLLEKSETSKPIIGKASWVRNGAVSTVYSDRCCREAFETQVDDKELQFELWMLGSGSDARVASSSGVQTANQSTCFLSA